MQHILYYIICGITALDNPRVTSIIAVKLGTSYILCIELISLVLIIYVYTTSATLYIRYQIAMSVSDFK